MKKKVGLAGTILLELAWIAWIYGVGGGGAAWIWSASIFILAPIAVVAFGVQGVVSIIRRCKGKKIKWNLLFMGVTLIAVYPITILFGVSVLTYPTHKTSSQSVKMINPVEGSLRFGGKTYKTHAVWPSECYAYDILKKPYDIDSSKLEDYGIYGAEVKAPISGTIIEMKDSEEDIEPGAETFKSGLGNYIFMKVEETGTYVILAHLEKDSIRVKVGEQVKQGEVIAKVGNSGTTSEPHLHIQHQKENPMTMKIPICAQGLPIEIIEN